MGMPIAYSEDLRIRAVELVDSGLQPEEVAEILSIGRATIFRWLQQKKATGSLKPKSDWQKGHSHAIKDTTALRSFALANQGLTAKELAERWGGISAAAMRSWLRKIGFTYKKKLSATKKEMSTSVKNTSKSLSQKTQKHWFMWMNRG
jgi:transposase